MAFAPIAKLTHSQSFLIDLACDSYTLLKDTAHLLGIYELFPSDWLNNASTNLLCGAIPSICKFAESLLVTSDPNLDDTERF